MESKASEQHLVELVSWLEKAGHLANPARIMGDFFEAKKSCGRVGYGFSRIETEGILEVCFWFPWVELEKVCAIDQPTLEGWLGVISSDGIEASVVVDKSLKKCVLVKRLHYIPVERRSKWITPELIPEPDYGVMVKLLNIPTGDHV